MPKPNIQKSDPKKYEGPTVGNQPPVTIIPTKVKLGAGLMAPPGTEDMLAERESVVLPKRPPSPDDPRLEVVVLEAPRSLSRAANLN